MFRSACLVGALVVLPVVASAQQPCTTDARRVVAEVYQLVLERRFDSQGENFVTHLSSGQMTVRQIVREVARLPEHHNRFLTGDREPAIIYLYKHVLGREPDQAGLRVHVASGKSMGAIIDEMVASREYARNFGDFGVPGTSLRYCPPGQGEVSGNRGNGNPNRAQMRFQGLDTNNNGIIERAEWNGTRESFVVQDWNGDNVLSGDEVQPGASRGARGRGRAGAGAAAAPFSSWNATTFTNLDRNRDGRLAAAEWNYDTQSFVQADRNRDGSLTRTEFLNGANIPASAAATPAAPSDKEFATLDTNRNGRIERGEWRSSEDAFGWLDRNNDGVLSRAEVLGSRAAADRFATLDTNRDGRVSVEEWDGSRRSFTEQDLNRDGVLTRREFTTGEVVPTTGR